MDKRYRILLVDGSEASRRIITKAVSKAVPATVTALETLQLALAALRRDRYDLISTALVLADGNGLDLVHRVRQLDGYDTTPIVVVTGDASSLTEQQRSAAGVTRVFAKSAGIGPLLQFVSRALQKPEADTIGKILHVEDSVTAATAIRRIVERYSIQVVHTESAEDALDLLRMHPPNTDSGYDTILTDRYLKTPMSGEHLIHQVRRILGYDKRQLPVLVVTASGEIESEYGRLITMGANDYVTKPVVEAILMARLETLIRLKNQYYQLVKANSPDSY